MKDYLPPQEMCQAVTPAPPSPPFLPQTVKDQCPPAGHQDSLMETVLTLACVALMAAAILVENVRYGVDFSLLISYRP